MSENLHSYMIKKLHFYIDICTSGCKSLIRPSSGKDTAKDKGVHREVESEGSRMANLWSDEQKSHQAIVKDKVAKQTKVQ